MNYLKVFENFNREQPLEKEDIIDLLEGTGINYTEIFEYPIRSDDDGKFYLGWIIRCDNPLDWVYKTPRNYNIKYEYKRLELYWKNYIDSDFLLSKITTNWKSVKSFIIDKCEKLEKIKDKDKIQYKIGHLWFMTYDLKDKFLYIDYHTFCYSLKRHHGLQSDNIKTFLWIVFEDILKIPIIVISW
jgi:hypothetical protein